jgi:hypothetical protein
VVLSFSAAALSALFVSSDRGRTSIGPALGADFIAFYTVGTILKGPAPEQIYDPVVHTRVMHELFPSLPADASLPYAHAPFEALLFRPLAELPYEHAYLLWVLFSLFCFTGGFVAVWAAADAIPSELKVTGLLVVLAFEPIVIESLLGGQVTGILFLVTSLSFYLMRRDSWASAGFVLPLCLYKPTLVVLPVAALMIGRHRRVRMLGGFLAGAAVLATVSVLAVGREGCSRYAAMVLTFGQDATSASSALRLWKYVDLNSFLRLLVEDRLVLRATLFAAAVVAVAPFLLLAWRHGARGGKGEVGVVWAATLTWLLVLNVYSPIYEAAVVAIGLLLTADTLYARAPTTRSPLPLSFRIVAALTCLVPWVSQVVARGTGLQPFTLILCALGVYQLALVHQGRRALAEAGSE